MAARMFPTRTHSVSGATLTTALPVLWTCQASSQPRSSEQAMAFMSCRTTSSNVWQSQLWRMVIHGGATATSVASRSSTSGVSRGPPSRVRVPSGRAMSIRGLPLAEGGVGPLRDEDLARVRAHRLAALVTAERLDGDDAAVTLARLGQLEHRAPRVQRVADERGLLVAEPVDLEVCDGAAGDVGDGHAYDEADH